MRPTRDEPSLFDRPSSLFFDTLKPRIEWYTKSMSLEYEPASEPLHRCRAMWYGIAMPGPESGPCFFIFKVAVVTTFQAVPVSPGIGAGKVPSFFWEHLPSGIFGLGPCTSGLALSLERLPAWMISPTAEVRPFFIALVSIVHLRDPIVMHCSTSPTRDDRVPRTKMV